MVNVRKKLFNYPIWVIILLSIPAIWALFVPGFYGASDDMHSAWLFEMDKILKMGQIPPRFVPDLSFGFGYPLFNFAFPLPFYIAEVFHLIGFSLVDSIKLVFLLSVPLSGILMYLFLKELMSNALSLSGAILYIYTPYRAVDIYIRGTIGEIVSFVFLPLIALSILKIKKSGSLRWVGIGSVSLASLILSHNITAYMFFPFLILLVLIQLFDPQKRQPYLTNIFKTFFLALLISCYFWLPAIYESNLMKYDTIFNFTDHFPTIKQLITPYWGYGASVAGPYDGMSFFLGHVNLLVLIVGLFLMILNWKKFEKLEKRILLWATIGVLAALFLMNFRSTFIWNKVPLLPYFQFPWRFLTLVAFFTPIFLIAFKHLKTKSLAVILIIITVLTSWSYFKPQDFLGRSDDYYLNRYIPYPKASDEYLKIQEEYLRLPKTTKVRPDANYPTFFSMNDEIVNIIKINDLHFLVQLNPKMEIRANFNKYYFPGWQAKIDGQDVAIKPGLPFGQISFPVPAGPHKLEVYYSEPQTKLILDFASLLGFLVALGMIFKQKK